MSRQSDLEISVREHAAQRPEGLTAKQHAFVAAYIQYRNGAKAARIAGYAEASAHVTASQLLSKPNIQAVLAKFQAKTTTIAEMSASQVLTELARIASADIGLAYNEDGTLKPLSEIPEDVRRAMSGIDIEKKYERNGRDVEHVADVVRAKFWDKTKALDLIGKHHKLFTEKIDLNARVTLAQMIEESISEEEKEDG